MNHHYTAEAPGGGLLARLYTRPALAGLGVLAIVLVTGLVGLSVATYTHAFADPARVALRLDRAGSQLATGADVKLNGIIVGRVDQITAQRDGSGATLQLSLTRDHLGLIPGNVTAEVLPKTLFGEKYVDLHLPPRPDERPIADGDTIGLTRTSTAIETRTVLNHVEPLLETVSPADLSTTLTAMATAVDGRGRQLGATIASARRYTDGVRPTVGRFLADARVFAVVTDNYTAISDDLLHTLANITVSGRTLTQKREAIERLLRSTDRFGQRGGRFSDRVGDDLVKFVRVSLPVLQLFRKYSPEFACFVRGVTQAKKRLEAVFADGPYLSARLFLQVSRGPYVPGKDDPKSLDLSEYGPYCPVTPAPGEKTVPWPPIPDELDEIRGTPDARNHVNTVPPIPLGRTGPSAAGNARGPSPVGSSQLLSLLQPGGTR